MLIETAEFIFSVILAYFSYTFLFFVFVLGVFIPVIPEELVLLLAGFLAYLDFANYWLVMPVAAAGIMLADAITYAFGRNKGKEFLFSLGLRYKVFGKLLRRGEKLFNHYDEYAVVFGRFIIGARVAAPLLAGAFGMSWRRFFYYSLLGSCLWVITAVSVGYFIGMTLNWALLFNGEKIIYTALAILAVLYTVLFFIKKKIFKM